MIAKRQIWAIVLMAASVLPALAQVAVDHYRDNGTRYVCSQQEILYDNFFHAARFAVAATADASGLVSFSLEVTYDEGLLHVSRGDSLTLILRGGDHIVLTTDREIGRGDIVKRHYLTYNDYYVTCHYQISTYDIQRISRNKVTKLSFKNENHSFDRKLDKFQDRFRRQFTAVYRYLMGN